MSHLKERKEKICLNCKATLYGRYCHVCGQENLEPKETVWHLIQHFFNDITHFDGKFFATVKLLLRRPGFLSAEYVAGRRASYLNPIRMYVFTSAIFFIILFAISRPESVFKVNTTQRTRNLTELVQRLADRQEKLRTDKNLDADDREELRQGIGTLQMEIWEIRRVYGDTTRLKFTDQELNNLVLAAVADSLRQSGVLPAAKTNLADMRYRATHPFLGSNMFGLDQGRFNSVGEYDSAQRALPDSLRDGWMKRTMMKKLVNVESEFRLDPERAKEKMLENLYHSFPKILFWSLPFFALILNILYFRRKKQFYYVDHGIFAIHLYIATFLLMLIVIFLSQLKNVADAGWFHAIFDILIVVVTIYNFIYLYKAMRGFYRQGRAKTIVKYFIVCSLSFVINLVLFIIFLLLSIINV